MRSLKGLFALYSLEGLLALLWTFLTPSETGSAVFLWLSRERLVLVGMVLLVWAAILALTVAAWRFAAFRECCEARLDRLAAAPERLGALLIFLLSISILILVASLAVLLTPVDYAAYRGWAPNTFPLLHSFVLSTLPLALLAGLLALELAVYLALHNSAALTSRDTWSFSRIAPSLLVLLSSALTVFYWLVLGFQLRFFANNPAWYWKFQPIPFGRGDVAFSLIALILLGLAYWSLIQHRRVLVGLLLVAALGLFLQFGVGLMSGGGFAAFQERYFSTYHKTYLSKATQGSVTLVQSVQQYEQLYGGRTFTNTKPPGLMLFYISLDHLINGYPSPYPSGVRYQRLSTVVSYAFPILAVLMVFALYAFARRFVPGRTGLLPVLAPLLLVLCPNLILFSLFPDQAIYPLVFLLGVTLTIETVRRQSILLAFLLGLFLYISVFFAFTMLPLYPFAGLYLVLNYWCSRRDHRPARQIWMALAIGLGTLLLYFLFRAALNYDFLPRFARTIAINHNFDFYLRVGLQPPAGPESLSTRLSQIVGAAWLNNLDFAAAIGFPIYILFLVHSVRLIAGLSKGTAAPADLILASLLLSFIVLILAGTAQGEVPRLWLFWLPMVLLLSGLELEPLAQRHPRILLLLAVAQLITIFLTFHFQDLRM